MHIGQLIRRAGRRFGEAIAVIDPEGEISFEEFDAYTDSLAVALHERGLRADDRVGVLLPNGIDLMLAYYALAKADLVRVALNVKDRDEDNAYKIRDSGARGLIGGSAQVADVEVWLDAAEARALATRRLGRVDLTPYRPDEIYRFGYTGGTTGRPKGVVLTQSTERALIRNYLMDLMPRVGPGDVMVHAAPMSHASGSFFLPHLLRGATNVALSGFDATTFVSSTRQYRATGAFLVPTMIALTLDQSDAVPDCLPVLNRLYYSASPIAPSVAERAQTVFGPVLCQTYGQSESPMCMTHLQPDEHSKVGSAGRAYTFVDLKVIDAAGNDAAPDEAGEITVRSDSVMARYWNNPSATASTLRDGWLRTGDFGRLDEDGYLYLLDRMDDTIISGGFNVYPREVEDVLVSHPAVTESAVIGRPDDRWGQLVHAVVVTSGTVTEEELIEFARSRLANYKRPRSIEMWSALPKSAAGKVLRGKLMEVA